MTGLHVVRKCEYDMMRMETNFSVGRILSQFIIFIYPVKNQEYMIKNSSTTMFALCISCRVQKMISHALRKYWKEQIQPQGMSFPRESFPMAFQSYSLRQPQHFAEKLPLSLISSSCNSKLLQNFKHT